MTTLELKAAIHNAVDNVPENALPDVLNYLNEVQHQSPDRKKLYAFIDRVFEEDAEVLRRLAQ